MGIVALFALLPVLTIAVIGNQQIFNAYLIWAEKTANLVFDSILSVSCLAGAVVFWRLWSKKFPEPAEITQARLRQPRRCDRVSFSRRRRDHGGKFRGPGFDRLAHHFPSS